MAEIETVREWGHEGEVLVFLHYFGGSAESWKWVAEKLSDTYRCVAFDLPGFGENTALKEPSIQGFADFIRSKLDDLEIKKCTLIGHSMGCKIALQVAADARTDFVQQLILIAPSPPTVEPMPAREKKRMLHHPDKQEAAQSVANAIKRPITKEQQELAVHTQLITDHYTWRWWLLEGMSHSIAEKVNKLHVPITVLASTDDPVITSEVIQEQVMQVLKRATLITTSRVGHLSPLESPEWVASNIRDIVSG
ncbi:alpha/beta hydrolase [Pontibacter sp. BT731]|uniref:alpha/beta fold hydrolase n=1 Tax=Pontibacter coccineus TaxID=3063328 RepID=UPI0026E40E1F|nr:alpha/beta hydrolase [Pontibacter sp. BT731]MDO6388515.1 alpha/beta hydrolase [Pontibacter sp. BT731]